MWIGLYDPTGIVADDPPAGPDSPHAANFKWVDGSSSTYRNWEPSSSEPNNCWNHEYYGEVNPIVFYPLGTWNDADLNDRDPQGPGGNLVSYGPIYGLVSIPISGSQAPAAIYDPVADYDAGWQAGKNPNGVWTYGWSSTLNSPLNRYKQKDNHKDYNPNTSFDEWNDPNELLGKTPCIWKNMGAKYSDSNVNIPAGALILHGGGPNSSSDYSHVVWTAPHDGSFLLAVTFTARQITPNYQTNVDILVKGKKLLECTLNHNGEKCSDNAVLSLIAGDKIDFAVGIPGSGLHGESTQLEAKITNVTKPSPRQGHERTTLVDSAKEAWQDSGIDVIAGQTLKVTASGNVFHQISINGSTRGYANPDGVGLYGDGTNWKGAGPQLKSDTILPSAIALSLIGKVGGTTAFGTGAPVPEGVLGKGAGFVGSSYCQKIPTSGRLFFAFNDELHFFGDNSGTFFVTVTVVPGPSTRPSTEKHARELAKYLDGVKIAEPVAYRQLSVYPILVEDVPLLRGRWLTLDKAISRGILEVGEKPGGSVPVVRVRNHSQDENVLIMTGEVIAGGMQTRTVRHDVVLAPGQTIDLDVFCVEAHRWAGEDKFSGGSKTMLPQSIQGKLRGGADQSKVWSEVARNNASLKAENSTGSLEVALNSPQIRRDLEDARRKIIPQIPNGTVGFIFVEHGGASAPNSLAAKT